MHGSVHFFSEPQRFMEELEEVKGQAKLILCHDEIFKLTFILLCSSSVPSSLDHPLP
jgi:hypothetical protein